MVFRKKDKRSRQQKKMDRLKVENMDRSKKENFRKYMETNPFYFQEVFPGYTIEKAWEEAWKL